MAFFSHYFNLFDFMNLDFELLFPYLNVLGLSQNEALLYLKVMSHRDEVPIGWLIHQTKMKRATVYMILEHLEAKSLILRYKKNRYLHVKVNSFDDFMRKLQEDSDHRQKALKLLKRVSDQFTCENQSDFLRVEGVHLFEGSRGAESLCSFLLDKNEALETSTAESFFLKALRKAHIPFSKIPKQGGIDFFLGKSFSAFYLPHLRFAVALEGLILIRGPAR